MFLIIHWGANGTCRLHGSVLHRVWFMLRRWSNDDMKGMGRETVEANSKSQLRLHPKMGMGADKLGVPNETRNEKEETAFIWVIGSFSGVKIAYGVALFPASRLSSSFHWGSSGFGLTDFSVGKEDVVGGRDRLARLAL
jgi:hypothetical protein